MSSTVPKRFSSELEYHLWCARRWPHLAGRIYENLAERGMLNLPTDMPARDPDLYGHRKSAVHEAGHAVVGALLGMDMKHAVVGTSGGGHVEIGAGAKPMAAIAMVMAGSIAERGDLSAMSDADREIMEKHALSIVDKNGDSRDAVLRTGQMIAAFYVRENRQRIEAVARRLRSEGKVSRRGLESILQQYPGVPLRTESA
jgi:hypothetical protein